MMRRCVALLAALSCTVLLGTAGTSQSQVTDPASADPSLAARESDRARNLGLAADPRMLVDGTTVAFAVLETAQQRDLNGDGDLNDRVVHVFDASTGEARNLGVSIFFSMSLRGSVLTLEVPEFPFDLNGDGDRDDTVLHVYDTQRRTLTNLRLSVGGSFISGRRVFFDGVGGILHIYDLDTGKVQNTQLPVTIPREGEVLVDGRSIFVAVDDRTNGTERTLHRFDTASGVDTNFGVKLPFFIPSFESGFKITEDQALVAVPELAERVDFNNDGDFLDSEVRRIDLTSASVERTGLFPTEPFGPIIAGPLNPQFFGVQAGFAVFNLAEADQGRDLNGDGDRNDVLLHTLTPDGQLHGLNINGTFMLSKALPGRAVVFMNEAANGRDFNGDGRIGLDLNRDGKIEDFESDIVVGLADLRGDRPRVVNTGLVMTVLPTLGFDSFIPSLGVQDAEAFQMSGNLVVFLVPEGLQGRDLNGDFIRTDHVLHIADLTTFSVRNTGLNGAAAFRTVHAPLLPPVDGRLVVPVDEIREGRPLNLDLDLNDTVLQAVDVHSGRARTTGIAVASDRADPSSFLRIPLQQMIRGSNFVAVLIDETDRDLNSDGDMLDEVLHVFDVASGKLTNVGLAPQVSDNPNADPPEFNYFQFASMCDGFGFFSSFEPGCAGPGPGDAFAFLVSEAAQGNVDLNGDGDTDDLVVHATRLTDRDRNGRFDFAEAPRP